MLNLKSDFIEKKEELNTDEKVVFLKSIKYDLHFLDKYHDDKGIDIKLRILCNPNAPLKVLEKMYDKNQNDKRVLKSILKHPNCSKDILVNEINKPFEETIETIGEVLVNPNLPVEYILNYSYDYAPMLKGSRLANPRIPIERYNEVLNDNTVTDTNVIYGLLSNPNVSKQYIEKIGFNTNSFFIQSYMIKKLDLSKELYENFYNGKEELKVELSKSEKTPIDILKLLSKHENKDIRNNIRLNNSTPSYLLREMIDNDNEGLIRTNRYSVLELREDGKEYLKGLEKQEEERILKQLE